MSLFKVSKTNQELAPSSGLETQSSVIEEENILNHPNIPQANNPEKDNLILETKDNDSLVKSYSRNKINLFYYDHPYNLRMIKAQNSINIDTTGNKTSFPNKPFPSRP